VGHGWTRFDITTPMQDQHAAVSVGKLLRCTSQIMWKKINFILLRINYVSGEYRSFVIKQRFVENILSTLEKE